ncbi:MAG TPA: alanine dehydrogenase [Anaerolineales bacterium]|nr:alanine dehydrogenase [Anaerolineales bacterium]
MNIGIPKERRAYEYRVGMHPAGVKMLVKQGHTCYVEHDAGLGAGFSDHEYQQAGARIAYSPHEVFGRADLLLKVARPIKEEIEWQRPGTTLAGLLHLGSARRDKIDLLLEKDITSIAYEQIRLPDGTVPIRRPLSEIGGYLAAQIAARLLQNSEGGKGVLIGGVPGVPPAEVAIIGAGVAGSYAARAFLGMGAHVTILDTDINALQVVFDRTPGVVTMMSNAVNLTKVCSFADVVVAAVLITGERPPMIITREMVRGMKPRSILMDISIDEGGCVETSRPTTHEHPTFIDEGVIHYCVPNMASIVARTATHAYLNAAFPFIQEIVNQGVEAAIESIPAIELGVGTYHGEIRHISSLTNLPDME